MDNSASFLARHDFLIRRLHSLSGLIPVGAYMCVHLTVNASVLGGTAAFQANVDKIHALGPFLPVVEWVFIFIPLLFHALFGFVIIKSGQPNTSSYPTVGNVRYTLQRATGVIAFAFIMLHVLQMHGMAEPLNRFGTDFFAQFEPHAATSSTASAIGASLWIRIFYAVGILACVFHLANGLWTMGITWGVWTTPAAQRRADGICLLFGLGLAVIGLSALFGFNRVDVPQAIETEERLEEGKRILQGEVLQEDSPDLHHSK